MRFVILFLIKQVNSARDGKIVDSGCHALTATYVRNRSQKDSTIPLCQFYEEFDINGRDFNIPFGSYNLDDMKEFAKAKGWCPYFVARQAVSDLIIYLFNILIFK